AILEEMLAMMEITDEGKFAYDTIIENMEQKHPEYTIVYSYPNATITGKLGTYNYIVSETEIKIGGSGASAFNWSDVNLGNVDTSTAYKGYIGAPANMTVIVSFTEDGKVIMETNGAITEINAKDPDNIDKATRNLSFSLEIVSGTSSNIVVTMNDNDPNVYANIEGLGTITYEKQGKVIYSNEEVLKMSGGTGGTYTGTWTVLESDADGNPTKLVSTSNVTRCTLGEDDNLEKCIADYKDAVNILNTSAQQATGIANARSINVEDIETLAGIEDSDKGDIYNQEYTYNYTNHKDQVFVNESGATVKLDAEGKEVTLKYTYYSKKLSSDDIGILASGYYWLASPCVYCDSNYAYFNVRFMNSGDINNDRLFNSYGNAYDDSYGVRAVVSI
ncbi:MAG: hypothetical protein IJB90_02565, partial [Clostridia bacterium]|nr:hypothetical protein [Clostridia bacterium]